MGKSSNFVKGRSAGPLISCLMISHGLKQRRSRFESSLLSFISQTYPFLELVILFNRCDSDELKIRTQMIEELQDPRIRVFTTRRKLSLGSLRNQVVGRAQGAIICQWDDDDLSHPDRVTWQWRQMKKAKADVIYLPNCFHLFLQDRKVYLEDWSQHEDLRLFKMGIPGSMMCRKDKAARYPAKGAGANHGEDVRFYFSMLAAGAKITICPWREPYYVYVQHGRNQWQASHHLKIAQKYGVKSFTLPRWLGQIRPSWKLDLAGLNQMVATSRGRG